MPTFSQNIPLPLTEAADTDDPNIENTIFTTTTTTITTTSTRQPSNNCETDSESENESEDGAKDSDGSSGSAESSRNLIGLDARPTHSSTRQKLKSKLSIDTSAASLNSALSADKELLALLDNLEASRIMAEIEEEDEDAVMDITMKQDGENGSPTASTSFGIFRGATLSRVPEQLRLPRVESRIVNTGEANEATSTITTVTAAGAAAIPTGVVKSSSRPSWQQNRRLNTTQRLKHRLPPQQHTIEQIKQTSYVKTLRHTIVHLLHDETKKIGPLTSLCACSVDPKLKTMDPTALANQTIALFNLASHHLLSAGHSCRAQSKARSDLLIASRSLDEPPSPSRNNHMQSLLPSSPSPNTRSRTGLRVPLHHLLHHLSLPPHSHSLSLSVLGFLYECGLTTDYVEIPVHLLTGISMPTTPGPNRRSPCSPTPTAHASPALSPSFAAPSETQAAPNFKKAEQCYIAASYLSSTNLAPGLASTTGCADTYHSLIPPRTPISPIKQPDGLALSRLAFLRKYGRPGVRIDGREAETLVALVNGLESAQSSLSETIFVQAEAVTSELESVPVEDIDVAENGVDDFDADMQRTAMNSMQDNGAAEESAALMELIALEELLSKGNGVDEEIEMLHHTHETDGLTWLVQAAIHYGHPGAQYALGVCHHDGVGVTRSEVNAYRWYQVSAFGGHPRGMGILGYCYGEGFGTIKSEVTAMEWYRLAAVHNESVAIYNVGYCLEDGIGVEKNPVEAVKWYRVSAEQGNSFAQNSLGYCYEDGIGVEKNVVEATRWYQLSAEQGYPWAECNLGFCYQNGIGVHRDETIGAMWYSRAAKQGHARAQHNLGFCYQNGIGVAKDERQAVYWYTASATHNNIFAFHSLGYCYQNGIGVAVDERRAICWYQRAADEGHAPAQLSLGYCYRNGTGIPVSEIQAVKYFSLSAEQGNALAQNSLGFCYEEGLGVDKDPALAVHWYHKSAVQANPWAQCNIGYCYAHGIGVETSLEDAVVWYTRAAKQDHARAQDKLGACYQHGVGVARDPVVALHWYRVAAETHGHVGAMFHLARCREEGVGCPVDLEEAVRWYEEAGRLGCRDSQKRMTRILSNQCLSGRSFQFGYCAPCA